mgnify:CR=1 FL=1
MNIILTLIISYCSIVISEMVPKRIAMQRTEQIARAVVPAIDAFAAVCRPIIWLIGKNTNGIVRLLGFDPQQTESEVSDDELRVLVSSNTNLSKDERTILDDVFDASETIVAEVMRPRADVVFIEGDQPLVEAAAFVRDQPYSRYPVTGKDFDDVIGFVHVRDLLTCAIRTPRSCAMWCAKASPCPAPPSCCRAWNCCVSAASIWPWSSTVRRHGRHRDA